MATSLLEVDDVVVSFGGLDALSEVTIEVPEGSIVGLIGPNGAGKTTLFNVISGLLRPKHGTVRFDGHDITNAAPHKRAVHGIGRSFQNLGLILDETVGVNIVAAEHLAARYGGHDLLLRPWRWAREERRLDERARQAAEAFDLTKHWSERIADLSFGIARFVELACVLVEQPRLMLLDEPTTGLDSAESSELLRILRQQRAEGVTVLLVAHDVRFVMELCDHVYVLAEGRLLADGPPATVQRRPEVIEAYLGRSA